MGLPARKAAVAWPTKSPPNSTESASGTWPQACTMRTTTSASASLKRDNAASRRTVAKLSR